MGKIEFANCQDVRNQKKIQELDCPRCHEPGGIEAFVKDGILAEDGVCDNCGYILPEGTETKDAMNVAVTFIPAKDRTSDSFGRS